MSGFAGHCALTQNVSHINAGLLPEVRRRHRRHMMHADGGASIARAHARDARLDGLKELRAGRWGQHITDPLTRRIVFAHPRVRGHRHADMYAGAILYLPIGKQYQHPSGRMYPMPAAPQELRIPHQLTDQSQRSCCEPDVTIVGHDYVRFYQASNNTVYDARVIGDATTQGHLGPSGYSGGHAAALDYGAQEATGHRSRLTDFVPDNDAFSTMHFSTPLARIDPTSGSEVSMDAPIDGRWRSRLSGSTGENPLHVYGQCVGACCPAPRSDSYGVTGMTRHWSQYNVPDYPDRYSWV